MMPLLAILVWGALLLGGGFGEASGGTVTLGSETMMVDLEVEVLVSAQSVVAHLSLPGDEMTIPLVDRSGGVFGVRTELPRKDYVVVFEAVSERGALSAPVNLSSLGVVLTVAPDSLALGDEDGLSPDTQRWGWLALALGAASLSALALWSLGARGEAVDESAGGDGEEE